MYLHNYDIYYVCLCTCEIQRYNLCTHPRIKMLKHQYVQSTPHMDSHVALFLACLLHSIRPKTGGSLKTQLFTSARDVA